MQRKVVREQYVPFPEFWLGFFLLALIGALGFVGWSISHKLVKDNEGIPILLGLIATSGIGVLMMARELAIKRHNRATRPGDYIARDIKDGL